MLELWGIIILFMIVNYSFGDSVFFLGLNFGDSVSAELFSLVAQSIW